MHSLQEEVIGGIKEIFNNIKQDAKSKKDIIFNTIVIDFSGPGDIRFLVNNNKPKKLDDELAEAYRPRGLTALFDAIGVGINEVNQDQDGVFVNILTDGQENSSREFKELDIKKLIREKKDKGWGITFMGTSESTLREAESWGISKGNTSSFNHSVHGMRKVNNMRGRMSKAYFESRIENSKRIDLDKLASIAEKDFDAEESKKKK